MRQIGQIGDVDPIEYGGGIVFAGEDGGSPRVEYFAGLEATPDPLRATIYRVDVGTDKADLVSSLDWVDWDDVAGMLGLDSDDYLALPAWNSAEGRAAVVEDVASHYGLNELDHYPSQLSVTEIAEGWGMEWEDPFYDTLWTIEETDLELATATATADFDDDEQAQRAKIEVQSLAGSMVERDGTLVYAVFSDYQIEEAAKELADGGFTNVEIEEY